MSKAVEAKEVMEVLHECLIALELAETREERELIRSQLLKFEQHITSSKWEHQNKASA